MTSASAVHTRHLKVTRGKNEILHGLDIDLPQGSITGLLGPSGCGKTTLMRALVGVQRYTGEARVLGHRPGSARTRSKIGYMAQGGAVYLDLTARQNVAYFAELAGARAHNIDDVLETVGLAEIANRPVSTYSGGQAHRVSLACALIGSPEFLVLDEPTVGLDPVTRDELWATFHEIADEGTTLLISSHVMDEAFRCDQVYLMRAGEFLMNVTARDLLAMTGASTLDEAFLRVVRDSESPQTGDEPTSRKEER